MTRTERHGRAGRVLGHYRLGSILGEGGMGEVYQAEDLALGRVVAVKLLRNGVQDHLRERLRKESEACARLEHPAIATFYEYGQTDGLDFLAMEYVAGETLRSLTDSGSMPGKIAIDLTCMLLEGLVHAHASGIVHRDIKPENVIVTAGGIPKLLDFGIAKELFLPPSAGQTYDTETIVPGLTAHGTIMGSPGYMSPEQLRGEAVDERTDIFSLGAVLYEMLAGEPAFPGNTFSERMGATIFRSIPVMAVDDVPSDINTILDRALARPVPERYPSAAAFLRDLRDLGTGIGLAALPNTLAIVDLQNLTGSEDDDWIGSGFAESLGADLMRLPGLEIVPRNKILRTAGALAAEDSAQDPVALGLALGCRWILTGTYRRNASRLRLTVRLVETATGRDLWVEKLDDETEHLFDMQDRFAELTAASLNVALPGESSRRPDLSVQELYARGRKVMLNMQATQTEFATRQFEKAIELDPGFAPAIAGLACIEAPLRWVPTANPDHLARSEELARRAIEVDPGFAESYVWLGYSLWRQGKFDPAGEALRTAAEMDPGDHLAPYFLGALQCEVGDFKSAIASLQRAHENDDQSVYVMNCLGYAHAELGHFPEAEWVLNRAMDLVRGGSVNHWGATMQILSWCSLMQGRHEEAWDSCREMLDSMEEIDHAYRSGTRLSGLILLAEISLDRGDPEAAEIAVNQALAMVQAQPVGPSKGHMQVISLALKSIIVSDRDLYEVAKDLELEREGLDFSWAANLSELQSCHQLAKAAFHFGEADEGRDFAERAKALGRRTGLV
jgi:serine/threonine protein kinase/tetratricopeptide (TPR) repeat protein